MLKPVETSNGAVVIDTTKNCVIIVDNGKVNVIDTPDFGTVEIPYQNRKAGHVSVKTTIKLA